MTEEEIKKLIQDAIAPALKSGLAQFQDYFKEQLSPIAARLDEFETVITEPDPKSTSASEANPETKALTERLAKMESLEKERQVELHKMKFDSALDGAIGKHSPLHKDLVKEIFTSRYGSNALERDKEWYLPNGSKLSEEIDGFFGTEVGLGFIPNPASASLGTKPAKTPTVGAKSLKDTSVDEMLADMSFV